MKGIHFKPENVRAIVEDRKSVTRQLDGLKEINKEPDEWELIIKQIDEDNFWFKSHGKEIIVVKPRYRVGEIVYIKEKALYWDGGAGGCSAVAYQNDPEIEDLIQDNKTLFAMREKTNIAKGESVIGKWSWRSPMFMPEWAARYFIKILSVRAERLQEITDEEAILEGISVIGRPELNSLSVGKFRYVYMLLWDSINPKTKWDANPFVWRYSFEKIEK